jgi:hypothetical protein
MGRGAHCPDERDRRQVEALAAYGVPETDIARVVGIDPKTLRKHYRAELDTGSIKANAKVAEFLFRKATTEGPQCVTAAIFWMKTRGRWKETTVLETDVTHVLRAPTPARSMEDWLTSCRSPSHSQGARRTSQILLPSARHCS